MLKPLKLRIKDKIVFKEEKTSYTIKACNERFAICTKPFNLQKTVFYCIVDFEKEIRSSNDLVFNSYDYTTDEGIEKCLSDLITGECRLSERHKLPLNIEFIYYQIEYYCQCDKCKNKQKPPFMKLTLEQAFEVDHIMRFDNNK